ncbi:unnamed protein product, partial [marine sediment metagenome]
DFNIFHAGYKIDNNGYLIVTKHWRPIFEKFGDKSGKVNFKELILDYPRVCVLNKLAELNIDLAKRIISQLDIGLAVSSPENAVKCENIIEIISFVEDKIPAITSEYIDIERMNRIIGEDDLYKNFTSVSLEGDQWEQFLIIFKADGTIKVPYRKLIESYLKGDRLDFDKLFLTPGAFPLYQAKDTLNCYNPKFAQQLDREGFFDKNRQEILENPQEFIESLIILG